MKPKTDVTPQNKLVIVRGGEVMSLMEMDRMTDDEIRRYLGRMDEEDDI